MLPAAGAWAAKEEPRSPWVTHWSVEGRHNPSGLLSSLGINRRHVYKRSVSPLLDGAYIQGGAVAALSPAFSRASLVGEWRPLSVFKLTAGYDLYGFFGANGGLLSFATSGDDFGTSGTDLRSGREEAETAQRVKIVPQVRWRLGRVIAVNESDFAWYAMSGDGPYYLELGYDTLIRKNDLVFANRTQIVYEVFGGSEGKGLWTGIFHEYVSPQSNFLERHRLGVTAAWVPARRAWGLDRPRAYGRAGFNVRDRNRRDQFFFEGGIGAEFDWY